jgi:hypothetical protein
MVNRQLAAFLYSLFYLRTRLPALNAANRARFPALNAASRARLPALNPANRARRRAHLKNCALSVVGRSFPSIVQSVFNNSAHTKANIQNTNENDNNNNYYYYYNNNNYYLLII